MEKFMTDFYTPPQVASAILAERQTDERLVEKAKRFLGGNLPSTELQIGRKIAFLARYVPRATAEDLLFAKVAEDDGFEAYWASYLDDRYTERNPEKVATVRPTLLLPKGQRTRSWVVERAQRCGGVGRLQTRFGYSAEAYQQGLREVIFGSRAASNLVMNTFDMGSWYRQQAERFGYEQGNLAPYYYPALMALTTVFGVLYEDFNGGPNAGNGDLARFTREVVTPAYDRVRDVLGVTPLVVQMPYMEGMGDTDVRFLEPEQVVQLQQTGSRTIEPVTMGNI